MELPVTTEQTGLVCPSCGEAVTAGDQFCEACGVALPGESGPAPAQPRPSGLSAPTTQPTTQPADPPAAAGTCANCGGTYAEDGYCEQCGSKAPNPRDHFTEHPATWVAGVCDRGIRHARNEDAMALAASAEPGERAVLVVCDGVTSATDSDVASLAAAKAARDVLETSHSRGLGTEDSRVAAIVSRLKNSVDAASEAVLDNTKPDTGNGNPPSCTFVAIVLDDGLVVAGSVGDSRGYWIPDEGDPLALTQDDSYAAEQIANGVPRKEAETGPGAHAITRWLGLDAPDHTPRTSTLTLDGPGWLLACSDGLWNYASEATDIAELVRRTATGNPEPLALAGALVEFANGQGGQDNITAAVARIDRRERNT